MASEVNPALINSLLPDNGDEELLGGAAAKTEREIIESNRVKLANYIHDVTTLFPLLRQEGIFSRDDVEIIESRVTTTAKVDKCLDVLLRKGEEHSCIRTSWSEINPINFLRKVVSMPFLWAI